MTRQEIVDSKVTLNGKPASISGTSLSFAMVRDLRTGMGCEWAWETCEHIIQNRNGEFKA